MMLEDESHRGSLNFRTMLRSRAGVILASVSSPFLLCVVTSGQSGGVANSFATGCSVALLDESKLSGLIPRVSTHASPQDAVASKA
jgi:hypothetical protein